MTGGAGVRKYLEFTIVKTSIGKQFFQHVCEFSQDHLICYRKSHRCIQFIQLVEYKMIHIQILGYFGLI